MDKSPSNFKLTIELVPRTCWYSNVRKEVTTAVWDKIRRKSYAHANNKCEICFKTGKEQGVKHNVECHEIWNYDDINKKQTLVGLISLCPNCHKVKHPGLAEIRGEKEIVVWQLMTVNNIDRVEAKLYIEEAFKIWRERSKHKWELDITFIDKYIK